MEVSGKTEMDTLHQTVEMTSLVDLMDELTLGNHVDNTNVSFDMDRRLTRSQV